MQEHHLHPHIEPHVEVHHEDPLAAAEHHKTVAEYAAGGRKRRGLIEGVFSLLG